MAHRIQRDQRRGSNRLIGKIRHKQLLDNVLALDRQVIEASMRSYGIPVRERLRMRAENRRLHRALKRIRFGGNAYV
jgi:hypothetical protein